MSRAPSCPFCGAPGPLTREHVWPQWLRQFPAYELLRKQLVDNRQPEFAYPALVVNQAGRLAEVRRERGRAVALPDVTVKVCATCNNGWMASLESDIQRSLTSWINGETLQLSPDETNRLAAWVAKTALAYALWHPRDRRPWDEAVYRRFLATKEPPTNSLMWLGFSRDHDCYVSMDLNQAWWSFDGQEEDPAWIVSGNPNVASFFMAAHGVVFFMHYWEGPGQAADLFDLRGNILGADGSAEGIQRIWPPRRPAVGPGAPLPPGRAAELRSTLMAIVQAVGLPVVGLAPEQLTTVRRLFTEGADPASLRWTFQQGTSE